jgi:hypothetical protein
LKPIRSEAEVTELHSTLNVLTDEPALGAPIVVEMTISNDTAEAVTLTTWNAVSVPSDLPWEHSVNAYVISVLQSYNLLDIQVARETGEAVPSSGLAPWVTPVMTPLVIPPGGAYRLQFDINELFQISSPGRYRVRAAYSAGGVVAEAAVAIDVKRSEGS